MSEKVNHEQRFNEICAKANIRRAEMFSIVFHVLDNDINLNAKQNQVRQNAIRANELQYLELKVQVENLRLPEALYKLQKFNKRMNRINNIKKFFTFKKKSHDSQNQ